MSPVPILSHVYPVQATPPPPPSQLLKIRFCARSQNCEKRLLASSYLSVHPNGTTRLPLTGFHGIRYLSIFFRNSVEKIEVPLKSDKNNGHFTGRTIYIYYCISPIRS
jgi:hypothetical protein